jgi:hypothetical protein
MENTLIRLELSRFRPSAFAAGRVISSARVGQIVPAGRVVAGFVDQLAARGLDLPVFAARGVLESIVSLLRRRYSRIMRYFRVFALCALLLPGAAPDSLPAGWKLVKDPKGACQITVPEAWDSSSDHAGSAVLRDATTAIAVVTSQPGQAFKPIPESLLRVLRIPKGKIFENSAKRVYYQDKITASSSDTNAFSVMVPGKAGTCSSRVVFLPEISEETARKIALSVGPVPE